MRVLSGGAGSFIERVPMLGWLVVFHVFYRQHGKAA
jgi:hypothetical protein